MRFFDQQEQARAQTLRLLLLFGVTVIALVLAVNAALALAWRAVTPGLSGYPAYFFAVNTAVILLFVLGGWRPRRCRAAAKHWHARRARARPGPQSAMPSGVCATSSVSWQLPST